MQLGGFDYTIQNPYWQNLDFGVRAHLWGEKIRIFTSFRIQYEGNPIAEDKDYIICKYNSQIPREADDIKLYDSVILNPIIVKEGDKVR